MIRRHTVGGATVGRASIAASARRIGPSGAWCVVMTTGTSGSAAACLGRLGLEDGGQADAVVRRGSG